MRVYFIKNLDEVYLSENDRIIKTALKKEKKAIYTSLLNYSDLEVYSYKISKTNNFEVEAEEYLYKELGLSYDKNYVIKFIFSELEKEYLVNAFVVEESNLVEKFSPILKEVEYIDFISAKPLVFEAYYNLTNTQPKNDIFIYLGLEESFIVLFKDRKILSIKGLDRLIRLSRELNISIEELKELLSNQGLDESSYDDLIEFNKINMFFVNLFNKITNILNYFNNLKLVSKIDNIYFYSSLDIKKLFEVFERHFILLEDFNIKKLKLDSEYDSFDVLVAIYNAKNYQNDNLNFSIFKRPPPFFKREIGKIALFSIVLIAFFSIIDFYFVFKAKSVELEIDDLKNRIQDIRKSNNKILITYKKYSKLIENIEKDKKDILNNLENYKKYLLLFDNLEKRSFLKRYLVITKGLKKFNLQMSEFSKHKNFYIIVIKSDFDNSYAIAKFVNYLKDNRFYSITLKKILEDKNIYTSKVSFYDR